MIALSRLTRTFAAGSIFLALALATPTLSQAKVVQDGNIAFDKGQSKTAVEIVRKLEQRHYLDLAIDDTLSSRVLDAYIKRLDGSRSFFLQSDIDEFEKFRYTLDDTLTKGDLSPAAQIFNRYQQRLISRMDQLVKNLPEMIAKMDFSRNEELELDRENAAWPASKAEADDIWRKRIKSRVLALRLANKPEEEIAPLLQKRFENQLNRIRQSNSEDAFQLYMNALTSLYDPHTNYLSPTTSENFNINMSLSLEGIGAVLQTEDEFTKVVRLVPGGPAAQQGKLQPSDRIVGVAQGTSGEFEDVVGLRLDEVVRLIRGEKGSAVRLEVIPVSAKTDDEHQVITIIRDKVKLEEQSAQKKVIEILHDNKLAKIGVIDVPAFYIDFDAMRRGDPNYKSTTRDVKKLLDELLAEGVEGIIIDLRDNGGGSLQEANQLTGLFIEQGPTVQIRHSNTQVYRDGKREASGYYQGPLAVLINRLSASASEIFAGAIQDYQRGIIIGTQSFGKGTVQSMSELIQGQLKITESKFYRISGDSTQHRGVIPDIRFPSIYDREKVGESSLDNALAWDRIRPVPHRRYYDLPAILPGLRQKHESRVKNDPDFEFLQEQYELMETNRNIHSITLNESARRELQKTEKEKVLALENKRRSAKGLEPLTKLAGDEEQDEDGEQPATEPSSDEKAPDPLLTETGQILMDAVPAYQQERYALTPVNHL